MLTLLGSTAMPPGPLFSVAVPGAADPPADPGPLRPRRAQRLRRRTLAVLGLVYALLGLEHTIVWVTLPSLAVAFHADWEALSWTMDLYLLPFAGFVFLAGLLADRLGRRAGMLAGLAVFGGGAVAAALAQSIEVLLAARVAMGIGAAACLPATFATIKVAFPREEQPGAIAAWSGLGGVGIVLGPVTGGVLLAVFSWRVVFWVMVPAVLVLGLASLVFVPESRSRDKPRIDAAGSLLWVGSLSTVLWGTIELPRAGLEGRVIGAFAAGGLMAAGFLVWELALFKRPAIDLGALFNRRCLAAAGALATGYFVLMGSLFPLAPYLQEVLRYEPWRAGLALLPVALLLPAGARSVPLAARLGPKAPMVAGLGFLAAATGALSTVTVDTSYWRLGVALALAGLGMGPVLAVGGHVILDCLPERQAGVAAAVQQAVRLVGGAFGIGVLGAVVASSYDDGMRAAVRHLPTSQAEEAREHVLAAVRIAEAIGQDAAPLHEAALHAYVAAMQPAMRVSVVAALIGMVVAFVGLPGRRATRSYLRTPVASDAAADVRRSGVSAPLVRRDWVQGRGDPIRIFRVDGKGPLIVLVPGWRSSARYWRPLLQWLAERDQAAIALNLPGLGRPAGEGSLFDQCNSAIADALDAIADPADGVILVGHSMGAAAAAVYAAERRDPRVAGLGLLAPPGLKMAWRVRRDLLRAAIVLWLPPLLSRRRLRRLAGSWSARPDTDRLARRAGAEYAAQELRIVRRFMRELPERFNPTALTGEVQWVFFAQDRLSRLTSVLSLSAAARVAVIVAGHSSWGQDATARLGGLLLGFAAELWSGRPGEVRA